MALSGRPGSLSKWKEQLSLCKNKQTNKQELFLIRFNALFFTDA